MPRSSEYKKKMSAAIKSAYRAGKRMGFQRGGKGPNLGKKMSDEQKEKISVTHKRIGHHPKIHWEESGNKNHKWKGDAAGYAAKHSWVRRTFGQPRKCEECGTTNKRMYHWANISMRYRRLRNDWKRLCVPCHKKFDLARKQYV